MSRATTGATLERGRWLSTGEAAELLSVTPRTVRRWVRDRWLSGRFISPDRRRLQVPADELLELLEANTALAFDHG